MTLGERHPEVALVFTNLGWVYSELKYYEKALHFYQKAVTILKE
jgi:tetratricopeptide (TPR) repeat protein